MNRTHHLLWPIRLAAMLLACGAGATAATAQGTKPLGDNVIELTADGSIEWLHDENKFVAEGNTKIVRNDVIFRSDRLIAHFRDRDDGGTEVWRVEFHGNIKVTFSDTTLFADDAAYEMESEVFVATGRKLRMVSDDTTVTARDTIEYWEGKKMTVARGNAKMTSDDRVLRGDIVVAYATENDDDSSDGSGIERVEVFGNVRITSGKQTIRADKMIYDPNAELAQLAGSVKITSGESQFSGEYAVYDFKTETGKMSGAGSTRAQGLFKSKKPPAPAAAVVGGGGKQRQQN